MKKIFIGILVSSIFIYFAFRGVEYKAILAVLSEVRYIFLIPAVAFLILKAVIRSYRWGVILSPIKQISQKKLLPISLVGYLAVIVIPMRIGEVLRSYLVSEESGIPMSSCLATILVERVLDTLTIFSLLFFLVFVSTTPPWLTKTAYGIFPVFSLLIAFMFLMYFKTEFTLKFLNPIINWFPQKIGEKVDALIRTFVNGFQVIANPKKLIFAIFLSMLMWSFAGITIYNLFSFMGIKLSIIAAFVVLIANIIGISLPTAPGMVGNFQYPCIIALAFFNIQKNNAFTFSMVFYTIGMGIAVLLGLSSLPFVNLSFKKMKVIMNDFNLKKME